MKIHEYQAKKILHQYGVKIPRGIPAFSVEDARKAALTLGGSLWVVKAQIHAGGRGKAGGVKLAKSVEEVTEIAESLLGTSLVTHQTGPSGQEVKRLYVEEGIAIASELYLAVVLDRNRGKLSFIASIEGGTEIEEVAENNPEKILKVTIDPMTGLAPFQARQLAFGLGLSGTALKGAVSFMQSLYRAFIENDCSLAEINPLVITQSGDVMALDAKITFDSNAMFRHKALLELRDIDEEDPQEIEASKFDLNYIKLDGTVGCMVNGAGLAMATMDIIQHYGGQPANFLDVGGGASKERVSQAFKIITSDPAVKGIFVNIFGGIVRCDMLAEGIVEAVKEVGLKVPLVVRLAGTEVKRGKEILKSSGVDVISADGMSDGAEKILNAIQEHNSH
jgi:succinyl-CoA synthetase beta subunit